MEATLADDLATGVVPLAEATDVSVYGSKAIGLGDAIRDGLPVPPGFALAGPVVEAVAGEDEATIERVLIARCAGCARRWRSARRRSTRTARTRASPASTSPC